jgi:hypothetical protein
VKEALSALRHAGLRRLRGFWSRPDFKVGIGGILLGFGPTIASIAKDVIESYGPLKDHPIAMWLNMIALPFVVCVLGVAVAVWGWTQNDGHPLG